MSNPSTSISPTPASKKPRRHPTSRGMRKHIRELKRLGLLENHRRRKGRLEHSVWLVRNPKPEPKKRQDPLPPEPRRGLGGGEIQRIWVSDLYRAKSPENLCPASMCGHLSPGVYVTVNDRNSMTNVQVRRCSGCSSLYRDFEVKFEGLLMATDQNQTCPHCTCPHHEHTGVDVITTDRGRQRLMICWRRTCQKVFRLYRSVVFADLAAATSDWNDCPNCMGGCKGGKTARVTIETTDAGRKDLCTCGGCGKFYKPYVKPTRGGSWWGSGSL